jgi:SIR2-like domain
MATTTHNPDQYMASLRQILSQGRKRIGLLVGAGAPQAITVDAAGREDPNGKPLIPGVDALTEAVLGSLEGQQATVARSIHAELNDRNRNIEGVLSRVRLLEQALDTEEVNGLNKEGYEALGRAICVRIGRLVGVRLPVSRNAYTELVAWIAGTLRTHPIEIFTTNYDLLMEEGFERARAPYFDGFSGGLAPFFDPVTVAADDLPARWSRLWKLHGSLGWAVENGVVVRGKGREANHLVYPDHLKYDLTQKQPYASLFERLKRFLLTADTLLLAVGCSFRDPHVCTVLDEALAMNPSAAVFAFQFRKLDQEPTACRLGYDHPNMSIYAADAAILNAVSGRWLLREPPKNWIQIRSSFWGVRQGETVFLLGDFAQFARFCAMAQATDFASDAAFSTNSPKASEPPSVTS